LGEYGEILFILFAARMGMHIPPDAKRCKSTTSDEGLVF
jgi:hypothetical protein